MNTIFLSNFDILKATEEKKSTIGKVEILTDYALAIESRENSLLGRKEVFMGKAKFGIFGDGKELAQIAMAKAFKNGDWRSGYYRDQTFMMAIGELTSQQFFAQLYAHTDVNEEPASAGRMMNGHFGTRFVNERGEWTTLTDRKNSSSDISPTAAQMPRLVGLAYASKLYRQNQALHEYQDFSIKGNEVAFGTIGNASTSEGHFFESINAAGVLQIPMVISIWDDGYGISVPQQYHTVKESISEVLSGFQRTKEKPGYEIFTVNGWDYLALINTFRKASQLARKSHIPCMIHVKEMTQPQGHSTSGSHERYKSKERLTWEAEHDCILKMKEWILDSGYATQEELTVIETESKAAAKRGKELAWKAYIKEIKNDQKIALNLIQKTGTDLPELTELYHHLKEIQIPSKADIMRAIRSLNWFSRSVSHDIHQEVKNWINQKNKQHHQEYNSDLYSESEFAAIKKQAVSPVYSEQSQLVDGREVLQAVFDHHLAQNPLVFAIGEDVGKIGDVNQGFAGLQAKHGELRVTDTGIRETTIIGQGIGAALRGLRPIVEIQYLDYLLYAIQTLSDDLATLSYRTKAGQKAPMIIRTRGHRLEGVWHSGSPMGMIINSLRGIYILVPRNMTQAAGFYNTMLESDDPALIIESLNGYRLKERIPDNLAKIRTPLGIPEVLKDGRDVTLVTYGSTCRIVMEAAETLEELDIRCEVIDVQTLVPFDIRGIISESIQKTNRVVFIDEDVPGGTTAYMLQQVLERDQAYEFLDEAPLTITGKDHRPAYGSDGDYFSKPNKEDIVELVYQLMHRSDPQRFPSLF
jgi:2-oxoisovalerate dehydrogenase E1 component